jgi:hypothetical protein
MMQVERRVFGAFILILVRPETDHLRDPVHEKTFTILFLKYETRA